MIIVVIPPCGQDVVAMVTRSCRHKITVRAVQQADEDGQPVEAVVVGAGI
jgi:hypothetical protein